jgi:hypothetical protein
VSATVPSLQAVSQQSSTRELRKNYAARGRPIPIVYGRAQVGGLLFALDYTDGVWTAGYLFCLGEIDGFDSLLINGAAPVSGVSISYYTGLSTQTADPMLAAAIDDYADTLVITRGATSIGIAYVVLQYGVDQYDDWPQVVAQIRGRKVYDPKTQTVVYSETPALHLADLLSSSFYGHGYTIDETSLEAAQDANEESAFGEVRRTSFTVIDQAKRTDEWVEVLRAYAACFIVRRGDTVYLVPDRPASSVMTLTASDVLKGSLTINKRDSADLPTVVRVSYTDTTGDEWRDRVSASAELSGVSTGAVPRREQLLPLPGVSRHSQAQREAVERLNKLRLRDLEVSFVGFDKCLVLEMGDVITLTHPLGLTSKQLRLDVDPVAVSPGRWRITASEYDPAAYSDSIVEQPTFTDGDLPSGAPPEAPSGLSVSEVTYQLQNGKYASRLDISWNQSTNIFVTGYAVKVTDNVGAVVYASNTTQNRLSTPALRELVAYTVEVKAYTPLVEASSASTALITIIGKTAIPDAPASLSGFEAGGEVRLTWPASNDVDAERYEIRYGTTGGDWDSATQLDIVDGLRLTTKDVPEGTWRFYVKTIDSIQQRSTGAATTDLVVTLDNDAFTAGRIDPLTDHQTATNMHVVAESRISGVEVAYSDGGDTWADMFGGAAMGTFTSPLASYQTAPAVTWASEILDVLEDKSGNWRGVLPTYELYNGSLDADVFGLQMDAGGAYSWASQLSRQASARYARLRLVGTMNIRIELPGGSIRADIIAREETGVGTSSTGGVTITLSKQYAAARSIVITPEGSAAYTATFDNIVLDSGGVTEFDVYIFNSAGAAVNGVPFRWVWKGI